MKAPDWWEFALLALATFRVYRLIAEDTILDWPRRKLLRLADTWEKEGDDPGDDYRMEWGVFITCPWCLGFWLSGVALAVYCAVVQWIGVLSFLVVWLALSATVGLLAKNLDADE